MATIRAIATTGIITPIAIFAPKGRLLSLLDVVLLPLGIGLGGCVAVSNFNISLSVGPYATNIGSALTV